MKDDNEGEIAFGNGRHGGVVQTGRSWRADFPYLGMLLLVGLLARIVLLSVYGPVKAPDSDDYVRYADIILAGRLHLQTLADGMAPITAFRAIGYPAVIAGARVLAGPGWLWAVVVLQIVLTFTAATALYRVTLLLCRSRAWACAAGLIHLLSMPLVFDQMILTDSLAGSLLIFSMCLLARPVLTRRPLHLAAALIAGACLAAAFLIREANIYLAGVGILPLTAGAAFADRILGSGTQAAFRSRYRIAVAALVLLPLLLTWQGYKVWNDHRLGVPVVTTAAQTTILQAMAVATSHDRAVLDQTQPMGRVAAETFRTFSFDEVWQINRRLYQEYGMTADQIAAAAYRAYFDSWLHHPLTMLWVPLYHIRMSVALSPFQPFASIRLLHLWATGEALELGTWRAMKNGDWRMLPVFLLDTACRTAAVAIFAAFVFGVPWRLLRQGILPQNVFAGTIWCLFAAMHAGYGMVHLEPRYLMPVIACGSVIGLFNIRDLWHWYRGSAGRSAAVGDRR